MIIRIKQKLRVTRRLEILVVMLTLATSCVAQAARLEYVFPNRVWSIPGKVWGTVTYYPTADAACYALKWLEPDAQSTGAVPYPAKSPSAMGCTCICPSQGITAPVICYAPIAAYFISCPTPTVNPTVPYVYNYQYELCERPEQQSLTITLSGGTSTEPSTLLPIIATVIDQNTKQPPANPVKVKVSLKVNSTSGGHDHGTSDRPRGGIAELDTCPSDDVCWPSPQSTGSAGMTDGNGQVVFNFNAPEASGTHTISATCDGCSNTATKPVNVKVEGLLPIPAFSFYALNETNGDVIGAKTGWHTDNHNLIPAAAQRLMVIASWYHTLPQFKVVVDKKTGRKDFPPVLYINDASLPLGGVYDICARPDACPDDGVIVWQGPHKEHRRGTVVDVRANGDVGSIPASNKAKFLKLLQEKKMSYLQESRGTSNEHFHLRLMGNKE